MVQRIPGSRNILWLAHQSDISLKQRSGCEGLNNLRPVFLCFSTLRLSDLDYMVHLALSVHCHCRRNQRGTESSQLRTSCQLTDRWCPADMEMVQMSPPHSRNLDTAVWHSSQIQHREHMVICAHYHTDVLSLLPLGQLSHVDCLDKDWKVPERQTVGFALPAGHAWPGGHSEPVTQFHFTPSPEQWKLELQQDLLSMTAPK